MAWQIQITNFAQELTRIRLYIPSVDAADGLHGHLLRLKRKEAPCLLWHRAFRVSYGPVVFQYALART